ncbi:ras-related protein Rab-30-like [Xenia sp. Carnegie-2017]|uniref:ras-related protein Rab-30-like n=1 Tax=Xenia sp. Carnegie-2017 TaxID=2897299 RepID=UPI001F03CE2B|nr:ras-related protein Rab-30-like [Xenia sp. Carnegie-2017]
MNYDYIFKVLLVGDSGVGKTSLIRRFTRGYYSETIGSTIGVDFCVKSIEIDGEMIKLQCWDTAGMETFRSLTRSYYGQADAVVLVYDLSDRKSFASIPQWLNDVKKHSRKKNIIKVLVGNKNDLNERQVSCSAGEVFAEFEEMIFLEASAKDADNVDRTFRTLAQELTQQTRRQLRKNDRISRDLQNESTITLHDHVQASGAIACCKL